MKVMIELNEGEKCTVESRESNLDAVLLCVAQCIKGVGFYPPHDELAFVPNVAEEPLRKEDFND